MTIQKLTKTKLEGILAKLETSEAKERFLRNLSSQVIQGTVKIPEEYALKLIEIYENSSYHFAIKIAKRAGMLERAISIYEKERHFTDAAELAKKNGLLKRAIDLYERRGSDTEVGIEQAITKYQTYRQDNNIVINSTCTIDGIEAFHKAAKLAKKLGMHERSRELYERAINAYDRAGLYLDAINVAKEAGMKDQIKNIYERKIEKLLSSTKDELHVSSTTAIDEVANLQVLNLVTENYECKYVIAARLSKKAGFNDMTKDLFSKAVDYYQQIKDFISAARTAREAGFKQLAQKLYETTVLSFESIGIVRLGLGRYIIPSIVVAEEAGMNKKVVELCERFAEKSFGANQEELLLKGARLARKIGMKPEAQILFEKTLNYYENWAVIEKEYSAFFKEEAAKIAEEAGMHARAQKLYLEAIDILEKKGQFDEAYQLAKKARIKK